MTNNTINNQVETRAMNVLLPIYGLMLLLIYGITALLA
jgi:hypothetical protein